MKTIYRYKAITPDGYLFRPFSTKSDVENWIESQKQVLGLDWRAGSIIRFRDGSQFEIKKMNDSAYKLP